MDEKRQYLLNGSTFLVRKQLKQLGCTWNRRKKIWTAPNPETAQQAQDIIYAQELHSDAQRTALHSAVARTLRKTRRH